jgi:hypothetical protein
MEVVNNGGEGIGQFPVIICIVSEKAVHKSIVIEFKFYEVVR